MKKKGMISEMVLEGVFVRMNRCLCYTGKCLYVVEGMMRGVILVLGQIAI